MSVHQAILDKINSKTPGDIFFPAEFRMLGTDDAIKMALSRLVKENTIERLANGVYYIPQFHHLIGRIKPSLEMIANAIAARDHIQIKPTGMSALNKLGLSEQVPTRHVYITNGQPRTYRVAENEIHFKSASPKKLALKGPISSLIILAMDEMGQTEFDETLASKIKGLLKKEDPILLENDMMLAPSWIAKELYSIISKFPANEMV